MNENCRDQFTGYCAIHTTVLLTEDNFTGVLECAQCNAEAELQTNFNNDETNENEMKMPKVRYYDDPKAHFPAYRRAIHIIHEISCKLSLEEIIRDLAVNILRRAYCIKGKLLKKYEIDCKSAAAIYLACRMENAARTLKEITAVTGITKWRIGRCYKYLVEILRYNPGILNCEDYINRFCSRLDLPKNTITLARVIARKSKEMKYIYGRCPISIAAAAIYMACMASTVEERTTAQVSEASGVCEFTICQIYKLLKPSICLLFPDNFEFDKDSKLFSSNN